MVFLFRMQIKAAKLAERGETQLRGTKPSKRRSDLEVVRGAECGAGDRMPKRYEVEKPMWWGDIQIYWSLNLT